MELIQIPLTLVCLFVFCAGFAAVGIRMLRALRWGLPSAGEQFLVATAVGILTTEVLLFSVQFTQHIRQGCWVTVVLLGIFALSEAKPLWILGSGSLSQLRPPSRRAGILLALIAAVAATEFLMAMAPLTGSDALNYHFAIQKQIILDGFHPVFSNALSFLSGQHHLLVMMGLALGSERLSLGFIFLGGILTAAAVGALAARWVPYSSAATFVLLFLLTPVVFWQISISGAPDIFMALFASAAIIVLREPASLASWRQALLVGLFAGGIAGAKYTGCIVALGLAVAVLVEFRSAAQLMVFAFGSLCTGIWPYARNVAWTRNPFFPFLSAKLSPNLVTAHAVASIASSTGATRTHNALSLFPFVFFSAVQQHNPGFFDFFGPTVLALAPLVLLAFRNTRAWLVSILVWFASAAGIFFASGLPRFLLVVYPIALACVAAGCEEVSRHGYVLVRRTASAVLLVVALAGATGLAIYGEPPILAAVGIQSKSEYLEQHSQDYQVVEVINKMLASQGIQTKTLVFLRHPYYLEIPYVNGDPDDSLEIDPLRMQSTRDWKAFLAKKGIGFVVRSPQYPTAIAGPLKELERESDLIPYAEADVRNLLGNRIEERWASVPVVVLRVRP